MNVVLIIIDTLRQDKDSVSLTLAASGHFLLLKILGKLLSDNLS